MNIDFVFCSYCSSLVFGGRCASCGAPVLQPKNFTTGELRKSIAIQKTKDVHFDYRVPILRGGIRL